MTDAVYVMYCAGIMYFVYLQIVNVVDYCLFEIIVSAHFYNWYK